MLNIIDLESGNYFCLRGKFYKRDVQLLQRVANLSDLCGILAASASKDLRHAKFLACVGRERIMEWESLEGCFRWLC